ncbi:MAG TPA: G5 domain-containing protein [Candidatus Limnocylindria bacterium]|nr:G5 domain-containing protein [Candidatus Limnocylindria bacterium]
MFHKVKSWFSHLSRAGKAGAILALLFATGAAAAPLSNSSPKPAPKPDPVVQSTEAKADVIEKKVVTETEAIPFKETTKNDDTLDKGETILETAGVNGVKTFTYEVTYTNGVETGNKLTKQEVTTVPTNEVTLIGTYVYTPPKPSSNCDPNYSPCVPNVSYDLDCPDIGMSVSVTGYDKHGFDRDGDGHGCESY